MTKNISKHAFAMWKRAFYRMGYNARVDSEDWLFANEYIQVQMAKRFAERDSLAERVRYLITVVSNIGWTARNFYFIGGNNANN